MRKKLFCAAAIFALAAVLGACGSTAEKKEDSKDNAGANGALNDVLAQYTDVYLSDFNPEDYVVLGDYTNLTAEAVLSEASEEEIQEFMDYTVRSKSYYEEITDREDAREGDIANIDYMGMKDGVAFDGGTAEGYDLALGSHMFIDGFEDGVIGMKVGETKDLNLTFPEDYGKADLAGAEVVFTVTLNKLSQETYPELNDEFVKTLEIDGVSTVEEYREFVRDYINQSAKADYEDQVAGQILETLKNRCTFKGVPEGMLTRMNATLLSNVTRYAASYGVDVGTYVSLMYGGDAASYAETLNSYAVDIANQYMMMAIIAEKEGISVTDEEVFADIRQSMGIDDSVDLETIAENVDLQAYREYLISIKVTDYLVENATVSAPLE